MTGSDMTTNETAVQNLVQQITQEALRQLELQVGQSKGVLAVLSDYVFDRPGVGRYLREQQQPVTCAVFGTAQPPLDACQVLALASPESRQQLAGELQGYSEVVLVTPSLSLIRQLATGDDREFAALLVLRQLLWNKPVTLLLDFDMPRSRRSPFFEQFSTDLESLESMGLRLVCLPRQVSGGEPERKDLVTEQDVKDAFAQEQRRIRIKPGAIVTQLASELARQLGVSIEV